ncbi:hypothetical protein OAH46_00685 [Verrucomicrobia bacterium]|nr:hypothetical protein [Verrucomicrobiota bacterium]
MEKEPIITDIQIQRSIFWKIYFFIFASMVLFGFMSWVSDENFGIAEIISILTTSIGTIGLYGYVFSKRLFKQSFWLCFLAPYIILNIAYFFITDIDFAPEIKELSPKENQFVIILSLIFTFVVSFPSYVGLLLYSIRSNKLWENNSN